MFEEASIFYRHRATDVTPNSSRRRRRSIVPWKATSEDIPFSYEIPDPIPNPFGDVTYATSDDAINTTLSFYEIRMLLDQVNF